MTVIKRFLFSVGISALFLSLTGGGARADTIGFMIDSESYFVNLEYSGEATKYREGETFFGEFFTLGGVYRPLPNLRLALGAFLGRTFGDKDELEEYQFYAQLKYEYEDYFALTFGNLDRDRHTFLDAIFDDTLKFERPTEHGMELYGSWLWLSQTAWINWQVLNTEESREKFDVGAITKADLDFLELDFQFHWIHRGGQLFSAGQPVSDDFSFALGGTVFLPVPLVDVGLTAHYLYANVIPDRDEDERLKGKGVTFGAFAEFKGFRLWGNYWIGDDFFTEDGDPFYQAANHVTFGLKKTWDITDWFSIGAAVDGLVLDGEFYFNEYLMISLKTEVEREISSPWQRRKSE